MNVHTDRNIVRGVTVALGMLLAAALPLQMASASGGGGSGGGGSSSGGGSGGGSSGGSGAGGGSMGGGSGKGGSAQMQTCSKGELWDKYQRRCVKAHSEVLPDEDLTDYAYALAKADRYGEALEVLNMVKDANTPKALNYRGYVTRHLGRLDEGISYYLKSVDLDPKYAQVREYLGEAYVLKGRLDLANEQLTVIKGLCGSECEEYEDLAKAIADPSSL